jgi:hypothetical protein
MPGMRYDLIKKESLLGKTKNYSQMPGKSQMGIGK